MQYKQFALSAIIGIRSDLALSYENGDCEEVEDSNPYCNGNIKRGKLWVAFTWRHFSTDTEVLHSVPLSDIRSNAKMPTVDAKCTYQATASKNTNWVLVPSKEEGSHLFTHFALSLRTIYHWNLIKYSPELNSFPLETNDAIYWVPGHISSPYPIWKQYDGIVSRIENGISPPTIWDCICLVLCAFL